MSAYRVVVPTGGNLEQLVASAPLGPFEPDVLDFIEEVSSSLLQLREARRYPELVAMAYWMRRANLQRLRAKLDGAECGGLRVARGLVFHIAPANVDTLFVYSWFLSMLCGNTTLVRLSDKRTDQLELLIGLLEELLARPRHSQVARRVLIVRYGHDDVLTAEFSRLCDMRLIWGGDQTVGSIRRLPLRPTSTELVFPNKFSMAWIDADEWCQQESASADRAAELFRADCYWFGQMACSSPRLVVWRAAAPELLERARADFWARVGKSVRASGSDLGPADYVNKLATACALAIDAKVSLPPSVDNEVTRVWFEDLGEVDLERHCGGGLFFEVAVESWEQLQTLLDRRVQTVSCFGIEAAELEQFVRGVRPKGIDRFVPFGKALEFSEAWDGFELLRELSRVVSIL
ncbi:MAG: gamma-glutamyl phosphate reductase [Candidatus Wallbacteria bacterium]|nr:gamma-glutamyl phosphate reductase [Candidatus Wallbacteria bacterium]